MNVVLFLDRIKSRITEWYRLENENLKEWYERNLPTEQMPETHIGNSYKPTIDLLDDPAGITTLGEVYKHKKLHDACRFSAKADYYDKDLCQPELLDHQNRLARFIDARLVRYSYWPGIPYQSRYEDRTLVNLPGFWEEENMRLAVLANVVRATSATLLNSD